MTWLAKGYGPMPISGEWSQRCSVRVKARTEAAAIRKARRKAWLMGRIDCPQWTATRLR